MAASRTRSRAEASCLRAAIPAGLACKQTPSAWGFCIFRAFPASVVSSANKTRIYSQPCGPCVQALSADNTPTSIFVGIPGTQRRPQGASRGGRRAAQRLLCGATGHCWAGSSIGPFGPFRRLAETAERGGCGLQHPLPCLKMWSGHRRRRPKRRSRGSFEPPKTRAAADFNARGAGRGGDPSGFLTCLMPDQKRF